MVDNDVGKFDLSGKADKYYVNSVKDLQKYILSLNNPKSKKKTAGVSRISQLF